jgi:hypothetical protein
MDIKKVYIDTRFRTADSKSNSDFYVELPRALNIPDKCVCYIDDIVIPVSWNTIDQRNHNLYFQIEIGASVTVQTIIFEPGNYTGSTFTAAFQSKVNAALTDYELSVNCSYDLLNNKLQIVLKDDRGSPTGVVKAFILTEAELDIAQPKSVNGVLMISETGALVPDVAFHTYLDLHTTRNLYLTSSSMGSYNTVSNFGYDTIIKKIPVRFNYNEMLFDGAESGYDYLDVSKRSLSRIDFRLQDAFSNIVNLNGNHWSFSLIFQLLD